MGKGEGCSPCAKIPGCNIFCNLANNIGCVSDENRGKAFRLKQFFYFVATVFGIVGAIGLASDAATMKNTYWCLILLMRLEAACLDFGAFLGAAG